MIIAGKLRHVQLRLVANACGRNTNLEMLGRIISPIENGNENNQMNTNRL